MYHKLGSLQEQKFISHNSRDGESEVKEVADSLSGDSLHPGS